MDARFILSADFYTMDQQGPPGRYPNLERIFWYGKKDLLIALAQELSEENLRTYERILIDSEGQMAAIIERIAEACKETQAKRKQG